jgi:hypothetical protein
MSAELVLNRCLTDGEDVEGMWKGQVQIDLQAAFGCQTQVCKRVRENPPTLG